MLTKKKLCKISYISVLEAVHYHYHSSFTGTRFFSMYTPY